MIALLIGMLATVLIGYYVYKKNQQQREGESRDIATAKLVTPVGVIEQRSSTQQQQEKLAQHSGVSASSQQQQQYSSSLSSSSSGSGSSSGAPSNGPNAERERNDEVTAVELNGIITNDEKTAIEREKSADKVRKLVAHIPATTPIHQGAPVAEGVVRRKHHRHHNK